MSTSFRNWVLIALAAASPSAGREIVHLSNGFSLEGKSHTQIEDRFVLTTATGTLELPVANVSKVEIMPELALPKEAPVPEVNPSEVNPSEVNLSKDTAELVRLAAASQGTAPEFIRFVQCVARIESGLRKNAISPKGALGLMQLMPGTAKDLGITASDPRQNAEGGAKYLRELLRIYQNDSVLALAAYNAGQGAVQKYGGIPPYSETWRYVRSVLREYEKSSKSSPVEPGSSNPSAIK